MALHLQWQPTIGGAYVDVDLEAERIGNFKLTFSQTAPARLSFTINQAQHTLPLSIRRFVRFWDDAGTLPDTTPQSASFPLFEGWLWEVQPVSTLQLDCVAYDPTHIVKELCVMSQPWQNAATPTPDTRAVPRIIFNATIANDVDYAYSRGDGLTVGQIITTLLDDAKFPMRYYNSCPSGGVPYFAADLAALTYIPQEKIVATNETLRGLLERILGQYYPDYYILFTTGLREWRFLSKAAGTTVTLTLNDHDADNVVSQMELHRSLDGRYPAVKIYGPETTTLEEFSTLDGSLQPIGTPVTLQTVTDIHGIFAVQAYSQFQIVDTTKRAGARLLPDNYLVRDDAYRWVGTKSPTLLFSFDGVTWRSPESVWYDWQNGIAVIPDGVYIYWWVDPAPLSGSNQQFWVPGAYKLVWAPFGEALNVRYPTSGFSGTSSTVAGQTTELLIYDELLAVGYNRVGTPVTTASRRAQFTELATQIHAARKDILYAGGATIEGLQYEFCRLGVKVNIAAVDGSGGTITTGWESIGAVVTDVEYDFGNSTTQITFSQEALEQMGDSIDLLKERLRIGLVDKIRVITLENVYSTFQSAYTKGKPITYVSGIVYNDYDLWYDSRLGTTEAAL